MKNSRITLLTFLLIASSIAALVFSFSAYQQIDAIAPDKAELQAGREWLYGVFLSIVIIITTAVLLLRYSKQQQARESRRRAKSAVRAGVLTKRIDDILKGVNDPFFALDNNYNFILVNSLAEKQFCDGKSSLLGENFREKCTGTAPVILLEKMGEVMQFRKPVSFEATNYKGDPKNISIYPIAEGISVHTKDITNSTWFEEQLIKT